MASHVPAPSGRASRSLRRVVAVLLPIASLAACGSDEAAAPASGGGGAAGRAGQGGLSGKSGQAGAAGVGGRGSTAGSGGAAGTSSAGSAGAGTAGAGGGGQAGTDVTGSGGADITATGAGGGSGKAATAGGGGAAGPAGMGGASAGGTGGHATVGGSSGSGGVGAVSGGGLGGSSGNGGSGGDREPGGGAAGGVSEGGATSGGKGGSPGSGASGGSKGGGATGGAGGGDPTGGSGSAGATGGSDGGGFSGSGASGGFGGSGGSSGTAGSGSGLPPCGDQIKRCGDSLRMVTRSACEGSSTLAFSGSIECAFLDQKSENGVVYDDLGLKWGSFSLATTSDNSATITPPPQAVGLRDLLIVGYNSQTGRTCDLARFSQVEILAVPKPVIDREVDGFLLPAAPVLLTATSADPAATYSWSYAPGGSGPPTGATVSFTPSAPTFSAQDPIGEWTRSASVEVTGESGCRGDATFRGVVIGCGAEQVAGFVDVVPGGSTKIVGAVFDKVEGVVACAGSNVTAGPYVGNLAEGGFRQRVWVGSSATFTIPGPHQGRVLIFAGSGSTVRIDGQGNYAVIAEASKPLPVITGKGTWLQIDCADYAVPAGAAFSPSLPAQCL